MASSIVPATPKTKYRLNDSDRQEIISRSDNPGGKIHPSMLAEVHRQCAAHVKKFSSAFS